MGADKESSGREQASWKLPPESVDEPAPGMSLDEYHEATVRGSKRILETTGKVSEQESRRFTHPEGWAFFWKPLEVTLGFGIPAIALIIGQFWIPDLDRALGNPSGSFTGLLRLGLICLGAVLAFYAAPLYKPADWTPEKQREIDEARAYFRSKRRI